MRRRAARVGDLAIRVTPLHAQRRSAPLEPGRADRHQSSESTAEARADRLQLSAAAHGAPLRAAISGAAVARQRRRSQLQE